MQESIGNPLMDKFVKDLIMQILAMISEQERMESKRRQQQGIEIAKAKGVYKGRPVAYGPESKNPGNRLVYEYIVKALNDATPITKIARKAGVTRQTVYRIKDNLKQDEQKK